MSPGEGAAIRPMRPDDVPAVTRLAEELGYPQTEDETAARLRLLQEDEDHALLVAEREGRVVGWAHVHGSRLLVAPPRAEIGGLVVADSESRTGVGRRLLGAAERWARERGYGGVRVRSNVIREDAHRFYEALGYRRAKTSFILEKDL